MLLSIIENISGFIYRITTNGLSSDLIFYLGVGFTVFMVLFFMIKSRYAYEGRLERALENINRWLYTHQQIDESNLVEFNKLIKKAPRLLRYHWQQFMLYREHEPSNYMSVYNCIEKPLHTSSFKSNIKNFIGICCATMLTTFALSLLSYGSVTFTVETFANSLITPVVILIVAVIFLILLRAMQNFNLSSLYQNFHLFNRYVDKASTTIPKYVDFEILFTRKEIRGGIPVLNEYLEKRARQEAEELERARQNAVEHEAYAFEQAGIDGSLILDRAMKESEIYLNSRQRLLTQIQQYDSEIESLKRNYENTSKDYQRKLQASKENIERLRQQQEESTNRIEVNYIRKQQQDEIKKQEQLEKDQDDATLRYDQETSTLKEQIDKCRAELEEKKQYATDAMLSEYDTFSTKLFKAILKDVEDKHKAEVNELAEQKVEALKELEKAREINDIKDSVINDLREIIHQKEGEEGEVEQEELPAPEEAPVEEQASEGVAEETLSEEPAPEEAPAEEKAQEDGYYDDKGYYWYKDGTYYDDKGLYHAQDGNVYDQEGNLVEEKPAEEPAGEEVAEQPAEAPVEEPVQEEVSEEPVSEEVAEPVQEEAPAEDVLPEEEQPVETEEPKEETEQPVEESAQEELPAEEPASEEAPVDAAENEQAPVEEPASEEVAEQPAEAPVEEESVVEEQPAEEPKEESAEPKKGRGRPKKEKTEEAEDKPKKGRGRPKKEKAESEEEPAEPKKGRGRPKKEKVESEEESAEPKRGRGRPKKAEEPKEESAEPKKGRGRPKKEKTEEVEDKPKRGRGRPRKDELDDLSNQILEESTRLRDQQNELNKQLDETLQQIKEHQERMAEASGQSNGESEAPNDGSNE